MSAVVVTFKLPVVLMVPSDVRVAPQQQRRRNHPPTATRRRRDQTISLSVSPQLERVLDRLTRTQLFKSAVGRINVNVNGVSLTN
eukprot:6152206-Amphidinium_carterae.1